MPCALKQFEESDYLLNTNFRFFGECSKCSEELPLCFDLLILQLAYTGANAYDEL
jgi:hypothetical protein